MYAIVKSGGKQYRVEQGQRLLVERLAADEGGDVTLEPLLYRSDDVVFDSGGLKDVTVTAKVVAHVRGEKLRVFKFKPKRGYKRRTGHRQDLTQIEVTGIARGKAKGPAKAAAEKPAAEKPASEKPASEKAARAKAASERAASETGKPPAAKASTAKPAGAKAKAPAKRPAKPASEKPAAKPKGEPSDGS